MRTGLRWGREAFVASSRRRSRDRRVFERDQNGAIDPDALPDLVVNDGRRHWLQPENQQHQETREAPADPIAAEAELALPPLGSAKI